MPRLNLSLYWLVPLFVVGSIGAQHEGVVPTTDKDHTVDYLRDVRPILATHCYECHGPDGDQRKGDLRLDRKHDAFAKFEDYSIIVPGNAKDSELIVRILSDDPDEVMPPTKADDKLKPAEIEILRKWINEGAAWQEHWAFVAPTRPSMPPVQDGEWVKNDIDAFILAQLEKKGLRPSGEATRQAWLRRVSFDLIGLQPTPKEIKAFVTDTTADAYEKVVDRLLADKRYGERMASDWLDVARYADSNGYQRDSERQAWKWRDWVINALNTNMPFDQFTIEQLAGDLLEKPTLEQKIATGFNRNHAVNTEAGEELDEYRSAYVIDRVHTTTTTWLGLTVACAQCHDHKYDPISQKEFYSFYGFFNSIKERDSARGRNPKPAIAAPGPDDLPKLRNIEQRIAMLKQRLEQDDPITDTFQAQWEERTRERLAGPIEWTTMKPTEFMARYGSRLVLQEDGSLLATGPTPSRDTYDVVFTPGARKIEALRIEVLPDPSLPKGSSGRADDGRFILSKLTTHLTSVSDSSDPPLIAYAALEADINQERDSEEHYLTAINPGSFAGSVALETGSSSQGGGFGRRGRGGWSIAGDERKQARHAVLVPNKPLKSNAMSILRLTLEHNSRSKFKSLIGRFRVSFTEDSRIRDQLVPLAKSNWRSIGPFPAQTTAAAFATEFGPEKDKALVKPLWKKKHNQPILPPVAKPSSGKPSGKPSSSSKSSSEKPTGKPEASKPAVASSEGGGKPGGKQSSKSGKKPSGKGGPMANAAKPGDKSEAQAEKKSEPEKKAEPPKKKPRPKRLAWTEQRTWRDGSSASVSSSGPAAATYLSRKIETKTPRTARLTFRGGVGAKIWLNGNLVGNFAPEDKPAPKTPTPTAGSNFPAGFNPADLTPEMAAMFTQSQSRRSRPTTKEHELHIGLRKGENHLAIKLIGKGAAKSSSRRGGSSSSQGQPSMSSRGRSSGGTSFTFTMTPEGEDILNYETTLAVHTRKNDNRKPVALNAAAITKATTRTKKSEKKKTLTPAERREKVVRKWYRTNIDVAGRVLAAELRKLEREKSEIESKLPSALVMEELDTPRVTDVFIRGDYRNRGEKVLVDTPSMLPPMPKDLPKNRLGLAKWLVSGTHPLTARVTVNRAWQTFFGRGIVSTAENFGIRGSQPTHPKLLDWLATEFVGSKWDLKKLHRLLVLSATYRQNGFTSKDAIKNDPNNTMLARGPHQRLSAEMVRDQSLYAAGLLKQEIGGKSVKPHQPEGLWRATLGSGRWSESKGDDKYRRGLYVYWKRGVPYPSFMAFDSSKRETCVVSRTNTTTPLQALVTLNDPVYAEAGRHLGKRLLKEGGKDDKSRIAYGFQLVASRNPDMRELEILTKLLGELRKEYEGDEKAAKEVLGLIKKKKPTSSRGRSRGRPTPTPEVKKPTPKPDKNAPKPAEAAAWALMGCTLLNLEAAVRRG
ncbi:MAG: mono/diheme cytochrome c family protein [Planctomycetota bacterium]|jgi:mono/diheme cytochrome c family protein